MRRKHKQTSSSDIQKKAIWLTTFNDLVTLLLVFFVLLFIMSSIDVKKLYKAGSSLRSSLGVLQAGEKTRVDHHKKSELEAELENEQPDFSDSHETELKESVRELNAEPGIDTVYSTTGIVITMADHILFRSGRADIEPEGYPLLDAIIEKVLVKIPGPIRVEGHTDNIPIIYNRRYPSNWELSIARAVNVLKYFIETGGIAPERLSAVGYGESKPLAPNDTPDNRAKNRRVEIMLITGGTNTT